MADDQEPRARKFHEGWIYHQPTNGRVWTKYWMVLRGNMMFIFGSDRTGKDEMKGTLTLGPDTELRNLPPESKKKGFKFELSTTSTNNERKINRFKFDKENDRDVWKAYVVGISVGIVPSDIHLLPGQLKDVHEAIGEVRNRPPPLPDTNTPRPRLPMNRSQSADQLEDQFDNHRRYDDQNTHHRRFNDPVEHHRRYDDNNDGNGSDDSGSFTSHVTRKNHRSESVPDAMMHTNPNGVHNLRQLMHRQRDLATRELGGATHTADTSDRFPISTPYREPEPAPAVFSATRSPPAPTLVKSPSQSNNFQFSKQDTGRRFSFDDHAGRDGFSTSAHNGHSFNNNQQHMFYLDAERNAEPPTWFFEINDDSRQKAEQILTMGRRYGNVLMRTSTSFGASGKYVISMRREVAGGTKLDHYEVIKTAQGFKINVDNKHSGMRCLIDVMEFFMTVAGAGTIPMRTNDLDKVFGRVSDNSVPPAPPLSPGPTSWSTMQSSDQQWFVDGGPTTDRRTMGNKLNVSGNVSSTMMSAVRDINYGGLPPATNMSTMNTGHNRLHETNSLPMGAPPPPPPLPEPIADYPQREYANVPNEPDTQFYRQHDDLRGGQMNQLSQGMGHMNMQQDNYPSPPPAPPIGGFAPPPPPPPLPPDGIPAAPPMAGLGSLVHSQAPSFPSAKRPSISQPANPFNKITDLQDELMGKLKGRKEEIYATATILKSNY